MLNVEPLHTYTEAPVICNEPLRRGGGFVVLQPVAVDADLEGFVHAADRLPCSPRGGRGGNCRQAAQLRPAVPARTSSRSGEETD